MIMLFTCIYFALIIAMVLNVFVHFIEIITDFNKSHPALEMVHACVGALLLILIWDTQRIQNKKL